MSLLRLGILLAFCSASTLLLAEHPKSCISADEAAKLVNKDVCIQAHVYDVVELPDGTRFLDLCSPDTPDAKCIFTVVSLREDREEVGELRRLRDTDVHLRGIVRPMHGRSGMVLSHARQFHGGPPKFKANPKLLRGFTGEQSRPPMTDPNLRSHGGHRGFMNNKEQETVPK